MAQELRTILPMGLFLRHKTKIYHFNCRTYNPKEAIALDRFVHRLSGEVNEVIERNSTQSAVTMKEAGLTLKMLVKYFLTHSQSETSQDGRQREARRQEIEKQPTDLVRTAPQSFIAKVICVARFPDVNSSKKGY